ncbi:hypothetical protein L7F22_063963 [Adiantum nelumboides]|nr:hypothetical protein [Adiantum nelumboides]
MMPPARRRLQGVNPGGQAAPAAAEAKSAKSIGRRKRARHSSPSPNPPLDSLAGKRKKKILTPSPKACTPIAKENSKMADVVTPNTKGKGHWCTPYVPFERKTVFCMTKAQAHEVYDLPNSGVDARLLTEANFTNKDWLKCFKEVPKRGNKVKCRDVKLVSGTEAEHFTKVEFAGGNKCEEQNSKVLVHDEKEDALDKEAEPDAKVEIVGGYNCEEWDPKMEVHVEKEAMPKKYSPKDGDQAKNCPSSMKDNEVSARDTGPSILQTILMMQRERKRKMTDGATRNPTEDAEGQTKTSKDQSEKETGENSNIESRRKDAATSNIDNLDHITSMLAKFTMTPPDLDTSFRVEGQVPCASNIEDQEDKNTEFFVLSTGEDTEIIMKKSQPPEENGDAPGGDASCAGDDTEIIIGKSKPPREHGDASVDAGGVVGAGCAGEDTNIIIEKSESPQEDGDISVDAGGEASCVGGAGEDTKMIIEKFEPPQEDNDASMDAGGDASCAGGAVGAGGAGKDMEIIIEKSGGAQEDGDASVDAGGDASCASGAGGAEYVKHDDGMVSRQREDGGGACGVSCYVRNDDGMVSRPWEDFRNIFFESKPTLILDINGVLLTSVDKRYCSQMPAYWNDLKIVDRAGMFARLKGMHLHSWTGALCTLMYLCGPAA